MEDLILVTCEAARYDFADELDLLSDLDVKKGIAAGHYTRPSLASIHSSSYFAALETEPVNPTLAEKLEEEGYTCIGLTTNPQASEEFGFSSGFDIFKNFAEPGTRGSKIREFLSQFEIVQRVYGRLFSWHSRFEERPSDREIVDEAIREFNEAEPPRFLWIHTMDSHRPYGMEEGISPHLNRKAKYSPKKVTEEEKEIIEEKYIQALQRTSREIERLLEEADSEPVLAFTGDHGEGLGENGYFFHPPYERNLDNNLLQVPVAFNGIDVEAEILSLVDIAPTLLGSLGISIPDNWQGNNLNSEKTKTALTFAPRYGKADMLWQDFENRIVIRNGNISYEASDIYKELSETDKSEEIKEKLRGFGYGV